jgi:putative flippase GtrA
MPDFRRDSLGDLIRNPWRLAWVRFGVVGASNAVLSLGVFWLCLHSLPRWSFRASAAQALAYAAGTVWSYYANRRWTFASQAGVASEALRFVALQVSLGLLSSAAVGWAVDRHHFPAGPSWVVVMIGITVLNFVVSKYWAFRPR